MKNQSRFIISAVLATMLGGGCAVQPGENPKVQKSTEATVIADGRFTGPEEDLPPGKVNLQRLLNKAPDGGVVEIPLGRYELATSLTIARRKNLHLAFAPGSQLRCSNTDAAVIKIESCRSLKISGVRARHVKPLPTYECHGPVVSIRASQDIHIDNCELNGCGAVGVTAGDSTLKVTNCHIHDNTWNAFYLTSCKATVIGNLIERNANTLQAHRCEEIMWSDNFVRDNGGYWCKPRKPGLRPGSEPDLQPVTGK